MQRVTVDRVSVSRIDLGLCSANAVQHSLGDTLKLTPREPFGIAR
jgi:hypothetical protein